MLVKELIKKYRGFANILPNPASVQIALNKYDNVASVNLRIEACTSEDYVINCR